MTLYAMLSSVLLIRVTKFLNSITNTAAVELLKSLSVQAVESFFIFHKIVHVRGRIPFDGLLHGLVRTGSFCSLYGSQLQASFL